METTEKTRIWNKKPDELTVSDNLKIAGGWMVVAAVAPFVVIGVANGAAALWNKLQFKRSMRKAIKELEKSASQ